MAGLDAADAATLARGVVAPQQRGRGPHPLGAFLQFATAACAGDAARLDRVLAGVRAYQAHPYRRTLPDPPAIAQAGAARLLDYGRDPSAPPVVFVPSLVNPPSVLDLAPDNSLLRWLAHQRLRPLLVDWGGGETLSVDACVTDRLLPLLATLDRPPALVGYCLGGTMAFAAAALTPVAALALIATPWRFAAYPDDRRAALADYWRAARPAAEALGALPMDMLQPTFWTLDPALPARKFERFAALAPDSAEACAFVALEDWANDGPPLALAAASQLFEAFFATDAPGSGVWRVGDRTIDPVALSIPILDIVSTTDRITPAAASPGVGPRLALDAGHVGMIVGSRARALLWEPLRDWLLPFAPAQH